jgi:sialate O-acetylesterase
MVLQQNEKVAFWGTSLPNEKITVTGSWGEISTSYSDEKGSWKLNLTTPKAGGPFEVSVINKDSSRLFEDVMIGEVWLASGQSNMEMDFDYCCNTTDRSELEIATANFPNIRMLKVERQLSTSPTNNFEGSWEKAIGKNITKFSAAGYFFAKRLHAELNVPIGIINSSWGGTPAEAWTSNGKLNTLDFLDESMNSYDELVAASSKSERWFSQFQALKSPSDVWYLFIEDPIAFPEKWNLLDFEDSSYITSAFIDKDWEQIQLPGTFDNIFKTNDFDGVILFRKTFELSKIEGEYHLKLGPISDMDFTYVNGQKVGASLGKMSGKDKVYKIPKSLLKVGENNIIIRVINQYKEGKVGSITLSSSMDNDKLLDGTWNYRVSAEVFKQLDTPTWPYSAFYLYTNQDIDFSKRPPVASFTQFSESSLFNGMIHPLIPYTIKGSLWYQGEDNVPKAKQYETLFPAMINDWRERWGSDFPFYFVQIAPFHNYNGLSPSLRDAQRKTLKVKKTGMVVTLDIGEVDDIHPSNKHDVGLRLAGLALNNDYGRDIVDSGPLYKNLEITKNKLMIEFNSIGSGLVLSNFEKSEFEIAGKNKIYVSADVKIIGDRIQLSSPDLLKPMYARYAWRDISIATLFNKEGLPASSFSTE